MNKKIEDYLPLYMGCEVMIEGQYKCKLTGWERGRPVVENLGLPSWARFQTVKILDAELIKPILRPLSDMTEAECLACAKSCSLATYMSEEGQANGIRTLFATNGFWNKQTNLSGNQWCKIINYCRSQSFDMDNLFESGLAIDKAKLNKDQNVQASVATEFDSNSKAQK
jgi:hypothetical protein